MFTFIFFSCKSEPENIQVTTSEENYPIITMTNPYGEDIIISPVSSTEGSIGYELDGKIVWIQGKPDQTSDQTSTALNWSTENGVVKMKMMDDDGEVNVHIELENDSSPSAWHLNLNANPEEYFTGIFERVIDGQQSESWKDGISTALNLRGERVEMHLKPTVSAYAPFYISSANYGFFNLTTWPGVFDFAKSDPDHVGISFEGPTMNYKIYKAASVMEIVQNHAIETGPSLVPPDWALGPWRWRDEHFNGDRYYDGTKKVAPYNTDIVEDVLMMKGYDIPCTAHWIDRPWGPGVRGFDDYLFDEERLPQPEKMIEWLNSKGMELMLWIGPFVMGDMADYAEENNFDLESNRWKDSRQVLMDFTNPDAVEWWKENGPGKLARMGVKGFKLDRADGEKLQDSLHKVTFAGTTYRENFNDYPVQYVKATYEAVSKELGDDFVLFPRAQYTGSAKYGSMWAGDTNGKPEGLRSAIIGLQRCAIMGYPVWGSDIGGYWGDFSQETTKRWLGFGCFSPIMETGPTNNKGFWNNPDEPVYDIELIATWRLYSKLRMQLVPYISEMAVKAKSSGTPIARPLFLEYPDQKEAWEDWQTYKFGDDILVSATWKSGQEKHRLYLPAGEDWIDAWNPENIITGGQFIEVDAPAYKIPFFIRQGSDLSFGDLNALFLESMKIAEQKPDLQMLEKEEGWR